MNDVDVTIF